jgi:hypothetical protein
VSTDYDAGQSTQTRHDQFAALADQPTLVIGTHWPAPTAGHIVRDGSVYKLKV